MLARPASDEKPQLSLHPCPPHSSCRAGNRTENCLEIFCGSSVVSPVNFGIVTLSIAISTQEVGPLSDDIKSASKMAMPQDEPVLRSGDATLVASGGELLTTESGAGAGAGVENANGTAVSPGSGDSFNWSSLTKLVFLKLISGSDSRSISYTISNFV